jgi:signal transduction histidine kinase/pSer/pThr/pTyr-binding forkhead associated (FHA) protein
MKPKDGQNSAMADALDGMTPVWGDEEHASLDSTTELWASDLPLTETEALADDEAALVGKAPKYPAFILAVEDGQRPRSYILMAESYVVGRDESCSIYIANRFVSRQHAYLTRIPNHTSQVGFTYCLTEGNSEGGTSTNGVYVNGVCIHRHELRSGDVIEFGPEVKAHFYGVVPVSDYQLIERLNMNLERQVRDRTERLQQAFQFEATLKRIAEKVRDSLDESQILQSAVQELALALNVSCCNAALFNLEQGTSTIYYEYTAAECLTQRRTSQMDVFPEIYEQLLAGQYFQFCSIAPHPIRGRVAMLACPIVDESGVLGDLWLVRQKEAAFEEQDIRLVEQVANQCAIALRQARLYQAVQNQVQELERLNRLKDDFLSTVSHELRTPISNMRMALQMLALSLESKLSLSVELAKPKSQQDRAARYFAILQEECEREIRLINDLLDLQRLDAQDLPRSLELIRLQDCLPRILKPFHMRTRERNLQLDIDVPTNLPAILCSPSGLERILTELMENACKYTPPYERILLAASSNEGCVQLSVCNSGVEIADSELTRIFDKFYRIPNTDRWNQGGTGLGLTLVRRLVDHLGGQLWVESQGGETRFTVELTTDSAVADSLEPTVLQS